MQRISHAQNAEDVRIWRAFRDVELPLTYVDVGANEPWELSATASLYELGWRGLLIEADPDLANKLRIHRPGDVVIECVVADANETRTFYRVPGTGLGTIDKSEAQTAYRRGFDVEPYERDARTLDDILADQQITDVHFMVIDVEGAEESVLAGLTKFRPWVLCIEAVHPGTSEPSHGAWEGVLLARGYAFVAFDGVNRWYVATEHADLAENLAVPFNVLDAGIDGWVSAETVEMRKMQGRVIQRTAWQRELILHEREHTVPKEEYEKHIHELRSALTQVEGSRTFRLARKGSAGVRRLRHSWHVVMNKLPGPVQRSLVRRRHLKIVRANQQHITPSAFLEQPSAPHSVTWITPEGLPPLPPSGWELRRLTDSDLDAIDVWLADGPYDSDAMLDRRTDNHGDEVGRVTSALQVRLALARPPLNPTWAGGNRVLVDVRSLQSKAFGTRGIGRFARATIDGVRSAVPDDQLTYLVDPALEPLPPEFLGDVEVISHLGEDRVAQFSVFVEPSPMTASAEPVLPILHSNAHKIAVVYDFIPRHRPQFYLRHVAASAEYAAALDALRCYDAYVCISHLTRRELGAFLGKGRDPGDVFDATVAWPREVLPREEQVQPSSGKGPIVIMTGDEPRKNTFGGLAAAGAATAGISRQVTVLGMAHHADQVHHWSIAAAMRPGEASTAAHLSDDEMGSLLAEASCVVVPSFDEGLSLPVIEALRAGTPVIASDIPAHRELIGRGSFLAKPGDIADMAKAIRRHGGRSRTNRRQVRALRRHRHAPLEKVIAQQVSEHIKPAIVAKPPSRSPREHGALSIAIATPWPPQRTGVADFAHATTVELAKLANVTVYTTSDANLDAAAQAAGITQRAIQDLPTSAAEHDVVLSVVGNSHYHLPFVEILRKVEAIVIAHDTRMVELYLALRDRGGVEQVMVRGQVATALDPPLDEQIDDMRLLQNSGFWEIAQQCRALIVHSPTAAPRIAEETGVQPIVLPFANQRVPRELQITDDMRAQAKQRLGLDPDRIHLTSFGYVDVRTKLSDVVVESAAWFAQWGYPVTLHLVGAAMEPDRITLERRAQEAGLEFAITGFVTDEVFRDWLLASDIGVQLRVSPMLGVSGPLSDLSAYGTPAVASHGLCRDVGAPDYVMRLPDEVSPVLVAEAIEELMSNPQTCADKEAARLAYLQEHSPARYAHLLLETITEVVRQ